MFKQNASLLGLVKKATVSEITSKGKDYYVLNAQFKLIANDTMIFNSKFINKDTNVGFLLAKVEEYKAMEEKLAKGQSVYGMIDIYPTASKTNKNEKIQFNKIFTEYTNDGAKMLKTDAFITEVQYQDDLNSAGEIIETTLSYNKYNTKVLKKVSEIKPQSISVQMYCKSFYENEVVLTSGATNYPIDLVVDKRTTSCPTIGRMYEIDLVPMKGKTIDAVPREEKQLEELSFENTVPKAGRKVFLPDELLIVGIRAMDAKMESLLDEEDEDDMMAEMLR